MRDNRISADLAGPVHDDRNGGLVTMMPVSPDTFTEIVEKFTAEVDALKAELREELAKRAQLQALSEWQPEHVRVQ